METDYGKNLTEKNDRAAREILKREAAEHPDGYRLCFDPDPGNRIDPADMASAFSRYAEDVRAARRKGAEPDYPSFKSFLKDFIYRKWELWDVFEDFTAIYFFESKTPEESEVVRDYLHRNSLSLEDALDEAGFAGIDFEPDDIIGRYRATVMLDVPGDAEICVLVTLDSDVPDILDAAVKGEGGITFSADSAAWPAGGRYGDGQGQEIRLGKPLSVPAEMVRDVRIEGGAWPNGRGSRSAGRASLCAEYPEPEQALSAIIRCLPEIAERPKDGKSGRDDLTR